MADKRTKKPFRAGDRVRVYYGTSKSIATVVCAEENIRKTDDAPAMF